MLAYGNTVLKVGADWLNYLPPVRPYTMRLRYKMGTTPTFHHGVGTLVDPARNVWDLHYENSEWHLMLYGQNKEDLLEIVDANIVGVTSLLMSFYGCTNLEKVALIDTHTVTDFGYLFADCTSLKEIPLLDLSSATTVNEMFAGSGLTHVPLFDTRNVTRFDGFLVGCPITTVPLFDTSKATTMWWMFHSCSYLEYIPLFDTRNVTTMEFMCRNCSSLKEIPLFDTSNVTNMWAAFYGCTNVESGALALYNQLSTQQTTVTDHRGTFFKCGINTTTGTAELAQIPADWKTWPYE